MFPRRKTILTTALVAGLIGVVGCASSHNLSKDGHNTLGGGYQVSKVRDGIFHISARTNWAPWVNTSGARSSWRDRAREACQSEKYRELEIAETSHDHLPPMGALLRYIVTTRTGYAVCDSANLSDEEALKFVRNR